ncbi:hypothetical protein GHT06_014111 [Daphnia sinensis]|uniref:chitinase n=1 Tax=Daphnia sinensis TaxID=1820382 RepID=A0AAD5PU93_9CRUS|nr:hypothetical protein GHT06_014111 [Daphnia sinensis]
MKLRCCLALVAAVTLLTGAQAGGEEMMDGVERDYANGRTLVAVEPVVGFNRGAIEHRPNSDDIRRQQSQYTRGRLMELEILSQIKDTGQHDQPAHDDERNRIRNNNNIYVEEEQSYPESYKGFNGHSYQNEPPVLDELERPVDPVPIDPLSDTRNGEDYKVVCYYESWAIYREEPMTTSPADVDPFGCTHVIYSFLGLDKTSLTVTILDHDYEVIRGGFRAALALKNINPDLQVMIAIGGWAEGGKQYSQMVSSRTTRAKFIDSVVAFMEKWKFDGFDLDWEYPGATDRDGRWADKENFALLVEEMSAVFRPRNWLLTAAVPAATFRINEGYDVPRLAKSLDFINVMTYDLHGTWDNYADHHAPLFKRPFDTGATQNLHSDGALSYWISKGAPASKIIFGIPFYGRNFRLANPSNTQPRAPIAGAGTVGPYTKEAGFVAFFEICKWLQEGGWQELQDPAGSPYIVKGDQWIGYDTVQSVTMKMDYIRRTGLGGAMIWAVGLDDIKGICGPKRPLLRAINDGLGRNGQTPTAVTPKPTTAAPPPTTPSWPSTSGPVEPSTFAPIEPIPTIPPAPTTTERQLQKNNDYKVVCYYSSWAWLRRGDAEFVPENVLSSSCTHVLYAYAGLDPKTLLIKSNDIWTDISNRMYARINSLKQTNPNLKVMLVMGGWTESRDDAYSRLVADARARSMFAVHAVAFLKTYGFDGLHLDWQYPVCWQADCSKGPAFDRTNYPLLIQELSREFSRNGLLLGVNVAGYKNVAVTAFDGAAIGRFADFVTVPTFDFHGSWESMTGHTAPLQGSGDSDSVEASMNYWSRQGIPAAKLIVGIPFYGQSFTLAVPATTRDQAAIGVKAKGAGLPGPYTQQAGMLAYYEICNQVRQGVWTEVSNDSPFAFRGNQWVGYDNVESVRRKANYIKREGFGGAMVFSIDMDDFKNTCCTEAFPLTKAIARALGIRTDPQPTPGVNCQRPPLPPPTRPSTRPPTRPPTPPPTRPSTRPPTQPPTRPPTRPPTQPPTEPPTQCINGQYYPVPGDCTSFARCVMGVLKKNKCSPGLYWNNEETLCDWPERVNCQSNDQKTPVVPGGSQTTPSLATTGRPTRPSTTTRPSRPTETTRPTRPTTTTKPARPPQPSKPGEYKVICYYTNWSWYRPGEAKYSPADIDVDLCTHILYGFATLDPNQLTMRVFDSWSDTDEYGPKLYAKVVALKSRGIKVLIALGGWNDSLGNKYSRMVNDPSARKRFIDNAILFIEKYGFDGLDLDWEYPKCWQVDCNAGPASDKPAFAALVSELRAAFNPRGWLLSSAVSPSKTVIDAAYDKTGHVAPFTTHSEADVVYFNTNYTLNYWIKLGADPAKLILGVPLYGQSFTLENPNNNGLNAPAKGTGQQGEFTRQAGFLAYYEICKQVKGSGWTVVQDEEGAMGPYAYRGDQWVSFDDVDIVRRKSDLVRKMKLGGAMIWALDLDDFRNRCGCETYPLLKTINRVLRNYPASGETCANSPMKYGGNDGNDSSESVSIWAPISGKGTSCTSGSFRAHESACTSYYQCVNGQWAEARCPGGLYWNRSHCDWSFNTKCGSAV